MWARGKKRRVSKANKQKRLILMSVGEQERRANLKLNCEKIMQKRANIVKLIGIVDLRQALAS